MAQTTIKIKQSSVAGKIPTSGSLTQGELALNTTDQKLYSQDSTGTVFEIGSGGGGGANKIITTEYIATAGQTSFATEGSASYDILNDHVNVYYNGMKLSETDFVATTGLTVVLTDPALVDDIVTIEVIKALNLANGSDISEHEFIATAGQTSFAIPDGYNKVADNFEVHVNGIKLLASVDFTTADNVNLVLIEPADVNDEVVIRHIKIIALANVVNSSGTSAIIPAGATADRDTSPKPGYLRWNTDLNSTEVYNGSTSTWDKVGFIDAEEIEDIVGSMVGSNTETNIVVTYDDATGKLNFAVSGLAISDTTGLQTALDGKVDDAQVLTNVPTGALFTDTVYTHPANHAISVITGLQTALDGKVDDAQVLTNVPVSAVFTDTTYTVGDGGLTQKNFTTTLKTKLDGIADSANNYTHPGAHAISVITGLQTALDGKIDDAQVLTNVPAGAVFTDTETTTSLSINANILKYTDEAGTATNIDLSLYLDDTNLARLTTGTLNGSTGVATFSRDDSSTFTVDFSALLDDTNTWRGIQNNLTSTSTTDSLSAKQGKVLQDGKVANSRVLTDVPVGAVFTDTDTDTWRGIQDNLTSTSTTDSLSAKQGKWLKDNKADSSHTHSYLPLTGKAADSEKLDGLDSTKFTRETETASGTAGSGWITVAKSDSNRHRGEVIVSDAESGDHAYIRIEWMRSYADSVFTVLNCGGHGNRITGARVLSETADDTYGWKYLQVHVTTSSNYKVQIFQPASVNGWSGHTAVAPVLQNAIAGAALHGNELINLDAHSLASEEGFLAGGAIRTNHSFMVDGTTVIEADAKIDANKIKNVPASWLIGDTDTQLSDADIGAMGYIKVDTNTQVTVNNTLTSTSTTQALSAGQGKTLQDTKLPLTGGTISGHTKWTGLDFSINTDNSTGGTANYFRGTSSHLVIGTGGTLYLNYGNNSGIEHHYGTQYVNNTEVIGTDAKIDSGRIKNVPASWLIGDTVYTLPASVVHDTEKGALHATDALRISGHVVSLYKGDGTSESVTIPDSDTQDLSISGHTISLTNGGSVTVPDTDTHRSDESVRDVTAAQLVGGTNVTVTEDDTANTLTITATDTNTTYSVGDGGLTQKNFTTALKDKLDGISDNSDTYTQAEVDAIVAAVVLNYEDLIEEYHLLEL